MEVWTCECVAYIHVLMNLCYIQSACTYYIHNQLVVIQRWPTYTVAPVYIVVAVVTLGTQPVGCYTEVACLYSGTCYSGHPWNTTSWLFI